METVNGMLKCPCCGAFITNNWEEKDKLRRMLNREYAKMRRDEGRVRKFGPKKYKSSVANEKLGLTLNGKKK